MLTFRRHALSILLLPFLVVAVIPAWLVSALTASDSRWIDTAPIDWLIRLAGIPLIIFGFGLFSWCVSLFVRVGRGTLAPWDPTRNLVAVGPYRFVRNPMISGVAALLIGQALVRGSWVVGMWACVFILINHVYFTMSEEPGLAARFGEPYRHYKANVPRWIPRLRPWSGE
jgi:protein-S-isoprenylcysteine O-methyltransferase Ste14